MNIKWILIVFYLLVTGLQAQTNHFKLIWDNNKEDDMYMYRIFRGNAENNLSKIDSVYFPDSTYNDFSIKKGTIYFYAIKAVDFALNASPFSQTVSAAVPLIQNLPEQIVCPPDTTIQFALDEHVLDPDHDDSQIQWQISGFNQLQVNFNSTSRTLTVTTPSSWAGQDRIDLQATDPDGFNDKYSMYFVAKAGVTPPEWSTIPQQKTLEDTPFSINLLEFVQNVNESQGTLTFSVGQGDHLSLKLADTMLTITPEKDWYGTSQVLVRVEDERHNSDSSQFEVVVEPVNDPPVLSSLPNFKMNQDTTVALALNDFVYDVDNEKASLSWTFANHPHVQLDYDADQQMLQITTPADWSGFEYIEAKVMDPEKSFAIDTIIVQVLTVTKAPVISEFPEIRFNEDESYSVNLNYYIQDPDTPIQNLFWEAYDYQNLNVDINYTKKILKISGETNWFGSEQFWLKVSDADRQSDSVRVSVTILPVNDPPFFKTFPAIDLSIQNPRSIAFKNFIADVDDAVDDLYLRFLPVDSIQITINDNTIQFKADENWYGHSQATLIVQDPAGASDSTTVLIYRQNLAHAPRIIGLDTLHIDEDRWRVLKLHDKVNDPDGDISQILWEVVSGQNVEVQLNQAAKEVTLKPIENWWGEDHVVFKASDADGYFDYDTLKVYVNPINDPPELKPIPDQTMLAGTYYTFNLKDYLYDADGDQDLVKIELLNNPNSYIGFYLTDNGFRATFFAPQGFHGNETFMVRATDAAGAQAFSIFVIKVLAKTIKTGVAVHPFGSGTTINFYWHSRMPTKDQIEYSLDYSFSMRSEKEKVFSQEHNFTLKNLEPEKTYHYRIVSVDENGNVIVNPDSVFTTGKMVEGVNVFPIPYRKSDPNAGEAIYFTNLSEKTTIMIFNLLGELVLKKEVSEPVFGWDLKNQAGKEVRSGIYIYHVKTNDKTFRGKLIIIR